MLKVNCARWNQNGEFLREEALKAEHPRTRERLMALYEVSEGKSATSIGQKTNRNSQTVMKWVHRYNQEGLTALKYQRTGGRNPCLSPVVQEELGSQIRKALELAAIAPQERKSQPRPRWTLKRFVQWVKDKWHMDCCRETVRKILKKSGFSWKKAKKLLNKGDTKKRAEFVEKITSLLDEVLPEFPDQNITVVWDGAPYHRAELVQEAASTMNIHLEPLPGYSPDFMPVEHLWQWLREDVTYHTCYESQQELIDVVADFQHQINTTPVAISERLWVKKHLEP